RGARSRPDPVVVATVARALASGLAPALGFIAGVNKAGADEAFSNAVFLNLCLGVASAAVMLLTLRSFWQPYVFKDDWRSVVATMNQQARPGDVAWLDPSHGIYVFNYYQPVLPAQFSKDLLPEPAAAGAWHVAERQPGKPIPASTAERWLDENWQLIAIIPFYRLELRYYQPPGGG
ncbi:MAG: hypothetical protein L0322_10700, partial [Chloroflexi bacterium]|nr:hypothetical protein [Chloroflexota bacterium]